MIYNIIKKEPYNALFLIGFLTSIIGVSLWVLFSLKFITIYPVLPHSRLMIIGFVFCFVSGFLMTAVPRMTSTPPLSPLHYAFTLFLQVSFLVTTLSGLNMISETLALALFLNILIFFILRKMKMNGRSLPSGFIFIPIGLTCGFVGQLLVVMSLEFGFNFIRIGKLLLYEGFVLNLIIGLGSRLLPILSRKINAIMPTDVKGLNPWLIFFEALFFNLSFFIEAYVNTTAGYLIRFLVFLIIITINFKFFSRMIEPTKLGIGIMIGQAFIPITYLTLAFLPQYRAHLIHIIYIGSISLLSYLVSVRVVLAHGKGDLKKERTSNYILTFILFFILAIILRTITPIFFPLIIFGGFAAAASFFAAGALVWFMFLKKIMISEPNGKT